MSKLLKQLKKAPNKEFVDFIRATKIKDLLAAELIFRLYKHSGKDLKSWCRS